MILDDGRSRMPIHPPFLTGLLLLAGSLPVAAQTAPGDVFRDCSECPQMVVVPAGTFALGSPEAEKGRADNESPRHDVTIGAPIAVGVHEVTFAEWDACARAGGCGSYAPDDAGWGRGRRPVINVNWNDAQAYVRWLSRHTGRRYRLLSEAEWEYVARAGTETARYWGETELDQYRHANGDDGDVFYKDGHAHTAPVGSFAPNGFGLYDVIGNVREWTMDCRNRSYSGAPADGSARHSGECGRRALRSGSWVNYPGLLRSASRGWLRTDTRASSIGFRVARTID